MKFRSNKKFTSWLLCMMLIVAMAFTTVGCNTKKQDDGSQSATQAGEIVVSEDNILGEGQNKFFFTVVDKDGNAVDTYNKYLTPGEYTARIAISIPKTELDGVGEILGYFVVDVGIEQGSADILQCLCDIDFGDFSFTLQNLERPFESFT